MSDTPSTQPAGWYYAQGDPPGTQRFWDGAQWQGEPQLVPGSEAALSSTAANLAEPLNRIGARLIDWILWIIVSVILSVALGISLVPSSADDAPSYGKSLAAALIGAALIGGYEVFMVAQKGGTLGKLALGLRVTREDGSAPDLKTAALRIAPYLGLTVIGALLGPAIGGLFGLVSLVIGLVSLVFLFTDSLRRTVWDRVAKTLVVATR
jgi:uncharacterized RDD family membrane protein YckC